MESTFNDLPPDWTIAVVGEILKVRNGFAFKSSDYQEEGVPIIRQSDLSDGLIDTFKAKRVPLEFLTKLPDYIVRYGDLLIGMSGSLGKIARYNEHEPALQNQRTGLLMLKKGIDSRFAKLVLRLVESQILSEGKGVAVQNVSSKEIEGCHFPLPPEKDRVRLVDEIEKQFSRLDEAVAGLKRIKANLKRYKASVLKAAVEGKLTEEWRKNNKDIEPAEKLLKRILSERKKKWEEKNPGKKYKEPAPPDTSNLPELPKGWVWSNLEQLAEALPNALKAGPFGSSLKKSYYVPKGYKIYGQEQVLRDDPYFGDYYIDEKRYKMLESCAVKPGDILISLVGTIGRVLILPDKIEAGIINPRLVKLSLDKRLVNAKFIRAYLQSPYVKHLFTLASHGGTMDILNLTILKKIPIPLPPREEQSNIIEEIDRQFSVDDEIEAAIETNLKRAERLRQAILKKAFSGRFVPRDSNAYEREAI